jgi:pyruvate/2-oxoglutarate dehydrogenase complex dihydrolipoamide dehydrogenase (E3) component
MKVSVDAQTRRILGAAILGVNGDEVIHALLQVMNAGLPCDAIARAVPIHPTVAELLPTLLEGLAPMDQEKNASKSA